MSSSKNGIKNNSNLTTGYDKLKLLVHKAACIENIPKFALSFFSIMLIEMFWGIAHNLDAGNNLISLNTLS